MDGARQVELLHGWGGAEAEIQRRSDSPFRWTHFPIRLEYYPRIRNGPHSARFNGLPAGYDSGSCSRSLAFWDILGRTPNWVFDGHCTRGSVSAPCRVFFSTDSNACSNAPHLPVFTARRCLVVPFSHFRYASATMKTLGGLGPTIIGVMLGQSILSAFFIFSRLYTKARINRSMGWDDHMATFSWVNNTKRRPERSSDEQSPGDAIMLLSNMLSCCDRRVWAAC